MIVPCGLKTGDRKQKTEDQRLGTEDRGPRTEDRGLRTEDRGLRTILLSIETLWVLLVAVTAFALGCRAAIRPNDFWWHLKVGEIIAATGQVPTTDMFSYTAYGLPWLYQSWLAEVAFHLLHALGGLELIAAAQGVLFATATLLVCLHAWFASRTARLAALTSAVLELVDQLLDRAAGHELGHRESDEQHPEQGRDHQ